MPQVVNLKIAGLATNDQFLGEVPPGALLKCVNYNHDRQGVLEKRNGFFLYGDDLPSSVDRAKQLFSYKQKVIRHVNDVLQYGDGTGTFTSWSGSFTEPDSTQRMKSQEMNGNFYFTTDNGIKKISAFSSADFNTLVVTDAGAVKALDVKLKANYTTPGFFGTLSKVAYRVVWAYKDKNSNLIIGAPSAFTTVINPSETDTAVVDLTFPIPDNIDDTYFYQIYRSAQVTAPSVADVEELVPEDELFLVIEDFPPTTTGSVTVTDITPDDFRVGGTLLYTNPISGQGILQANEAPPLAKDIASYKNFAFYANTKSKHRTTINLLSLLDFVSGDTKLVIADGVDVNEFTFIGVTSESTIDWTTANYGTPGATLDGTYFFLTSASNEREYFLWFDGTGTSSAPTNLDVAGKIEIKVDVSAATTNEDIVDAMKAILDLTLDFTTTKSGAGGTDSTITITNCCNGTTSPFHISNTATVPVPTPAGGSLVFTDQTIVGDGEDAGASEILLSSKLTPGQRVEETANSIVRVINAQAGGITSAQYLSGPSDVPGQILFEARELKDIPFYLGIEETTPGANTKFNPVLASVKPITSYTQANPAEFTVTAHGYSSSNSVLIFDNVSDSPNVDGLHTIGVTGANTFTIPVDTTVGTVGTGGRVMLADVASDNEVSPNRLFFSKQQQPEAVPLVNFLDVGPKDKAILRIISLRDSLFILKEDGVYRLSGESSSSFVLSLWDSSAIITAPDSADILNNVIYALTSQGVVRIADTGVEIESKAIENYINASTLLNDNFPSYSFGFASESDRSYYLWTTTKSTDTVATQCLRFNSDTRSWTVWDLAKTCGVVNDGDSKIYLGSSDTNRIEKERKNLDRTDKADREFPVQLNNAGVSGKKIIALSSLVNVEIGDVIYQKQYLTISQYNRLLRKLDLDQGMTDTDYESTLKMIVGDSIGVKMIDLAAKLNLDDTNGFTDTHGNTSYVYTNPSAHVDIQTEFNKITDRLNESPTTVHVNYFDSIGTTNYEALIDDKDKDFNTITLFRMPPFIVGDMTVYKAFESTVIWVPNHAGDPSILKRITDATVIFDDLSFTTGKVAYQTDLIKSFNGPEFEGAGTGVFGRVDFGNEGFGGIASSRPQRVLVPRDKSRARYVSVRYIHSNAREEIKLFGITLTVEMTTQKAYRN